MRIDLKNLFGMATGSIISTRLWPLSPSNHLFNTSDKTEILFHFRRHYFDMNSNCKCFFHYVLVASQISSDPQIVNPLFLYMFLENLTFLQWSIMGFQDDNLFPLYFSTVNFIIQCGFLEAQEASRSFSMVSYTM